LVPRFDHEFNVYWEGRDKTFNDGTAILDFAFDSFAEILRKEADKAGHTDTEESGSSPRASLALLHGDRLNTIGSVIRRFVDLGTYRLRYHFL